MAVIKVRWHVDDLADVMAIFDVQRVYRSTAGDGGPWTEITTVPTRVPLVVGVENYFFDDVAGDPAYYYCVDYYNTVTLLASDKSAAQRGDLAGYLTLADVRNEGYPETLVTDAQVARGAWLATTMIDRVTGQWFEARRRTLRLDGRGGTNLFLSVPIISLLSADNGDTELELTRDDLLIYNRYLTCGFPDDRSNPMLSLVESTWVTQRQAVVLDGYFGYTELGPDDVPGEASEQVPLHYGRVPELIRRAALLLTSRFMWGLASGRGEEFAARARVISESTRDQSYSLQPLSAADAAYGVTGDNEVDSILSQFSSPLSAGGI